MNPEEARLILHCRRPLGQDDADPAIAEALAVLRADPAAAAEIEADTRFDTQFAACVRSLPVPSSLRGNILAGRRLSARPRRIHPAWLAAAAALAIAAPAAWKYWPAQNGRVVFASTTLSDFRQAAATKLTTHDFQLTPAASMDQLKVQLQHRTPAVPESLCHCPGGMLGCDVFQWHGNEVTLICFDAGSAGAVHLFTVDASALKDGPSGPIYQTTGGWSTLAWHCPCSGKIMLLAGEEKRITGAELSKLIATAK